MTYREIGMKIILTLIPAALIIILVRMSEPDHDGGSGSCMCRHYPEF